MSQSPSRNNATDPVNIARTSTEKNPSDVDAFPPEGTDEKVLEKHAEKPLSEKERLRATRAALNAAPSKAD